jgi:porin
MDQIGFGLGRYKFNDKVASNSNKDDEIDFELNYVYNYSPAVMIRPNLQYVYQPNGLDTIDDAWVAGVSVKLNF